MSNSIWLPVCSKNDTRTLRHFGIGFSVLLCGLFMGLFPFLSNHAIPLWPSYISAVLCSLAIIKPTWLYIPYRMWMVIASILNAVNTRLIMFIAFFALIVPIGLCMRLFNKAPYSRHPVAQKKSYWVERETIPEVQNLKEPF